MVLAKVAGLGSFAAIVTLTLWMRPQDVLKIRTAVVAAL